ncbi:hypothetical protein MLD38_039372 [Melastoma candidum]|uniref:Uncharacterized protein n=1 Tax=Melastoma candidum TaxID=119954 RepID=A0ACB9L481_9MYRT|nr:hypothetical protein MLD38_039372 [Melastoma candidum]
MKTQTSCLLSVHTFLLLLGLSRVAFSLPPPLPVPFIPPDCYLVDCGSPWQTRLDDGRAFRSDQESSPLLSTGRDVIASVGSISMTGSSDYQASFTIPLYRTARIFPDDAMYVFLASRPGLHWIRLYFHPIPHPVYNLANAVFSVTANELVLLSDFKVQDPTVLVFKEYLINLPANATKLVLKFTSRKDLFSFVNAIEFVSVPDSLISTSATAIPPTGGFQGSLLDYAYEVIYRLNVGGPPISPGNDTLMRTWQSDDPYMTFPQGASNVSVPFSTIKFPSQGATQDVAPYAVYATADQMTDSGVSQQDFNLTWEVSCDPSFSHLIRVHFCDIVSTSLNELYFNVYINGITAALALDLSLLTGGLDTPYYMDFVVSPSVIRNGSITIQLGPASSIEPNLPNVILNGLEVLKMSEHGSLDIPRGSNFGEPGLSANKKRIVAIAVLATGVSAALLLARKFVAGKKKDWEHMNHKSFSSSLRPLGNSRARLLSSRESYLSSLFGSTKSRTSFSSMFMSAGFGRLFSFKELQEATQCFSEKAAIGIGGFGKVYVGTLPDGSKVAIKRGNPTSQQGFNEFQTEIQMLSRVRHRHLVSLIGYCDENSEMILVYEYMANGPLRDHLHGSLNLTPLSWKQRLEICIGAARGLHYLHSGAAIIHRDVKSTNILLDENFIAKVSDFGLSKAAPNLDQTHVSTAVKGSIGYLDPEYFRRQQLSDKSDVYSFGVVLFEVLCSRPALDPGLPREQVSLAEWAMKMNREGTLRGIIDPRIVNEISSDSIAKFADAAEKCLAEDGVDRPTMSDVLWKLELALKLQEGFSDAGSPK